MSRAIGQPRTMGLSLLGDRLSAEQAERWGLIWACVDDDKLEQETARIAKRLAALPAHAAQEARAVLRRAQDASLAEQLDYESARQRELINGECCAEGVRAFKARRAPAFPPRSL
jgi:2-(1,2-epoxy-1,2-dihydrophenyl)acetyl-CoA isomerase